MCLTFSRKWRRTALAGFRANEQEMSFVGLRLKWSSFAPKARIVMHNVVTVSFWCTTRCSYILKRLQCCISSTVWGENIISHKHVLRKVTKQIKFIHSKKEAQIFLHSAQHKCLSTENALFRLSSSRFTPRSAVLVLQVRCLWSVKWLSLEGSALVSTEIKRKFLSFTLHNLQLMNVKNVGNGF